MEKWEIFCLFLVLYGVTSSVAQVSPNKLCTDNFNPDACQQIARDQDINCQIVTSKVDCILDADEGLPTLSVLNPEEAFLGAGLVTNNPTVIAEIVEEYPPYQTAVIVKAGYLGGFEPLQGLQYCHPGYNHDELVSKYVLEQLDWKAINLSCNINKTLVEQKFEALSSWFGASCRPGRWTVDDDLDARLKTQYSSLCALCGSDGCNTKYQLPLNATLQCLTDNSADVALTALTYAEAFFGIGANAQDYRYLCQNGTVALSTSPCTWTNQLNRLIITSSDSIATMQTYVQTKLSSRINSNGDGSLPSTTERYLEIILQLGSSDKINLISPTPLRTYVLERRPIPQINDSIQCGLTLNWSVTNEIERNKCTWLQQASLTAGLQPIVFCILSNENDTISNIDNIKSDVADLAFADANFGYIARRKGLINIAYPETDSQQLSKIVIVVLNTTTWYNNTGFKSLQGKRICLPEYGGKEWLTFIDLLRTNGVLGNSCDYGKLFSDFVGESCAPGANAKDYNIDNTDSDKLCSNCIPVEGTTTAKYCNADVGNKYYDSLGALTCLREDNGDYAVIALNDLPRHYARILDVQQFRVISKNGSLAAYNGFDVDEGSPIAILIAGEVIVKNGTTKFNDTKLYLRSIEVEFGQNLRKSFKVFESFDETRNLLFPDSTPGLTFGGSPNLYIQNFSTPLQNSEICHQIPSGAYISLPIIFSVIVGTALTRFM